jgi:predicted Zn-dependent peptidase
MSCSLSFIALSHIPASMLHHQLHRKTLSNGIVAIAVNNPSTDIMAARLFFRAGSRYDIIPGTGHLMATVMTKGTSRQSSMEIAEQVESIGASLGTESTTDYFLVSLKTISADFGEMLKLTSEIVRDPSFPEQEVELEKRLTLQSIRSQREQPFSIAFSELRSAMYADHPYALSTLGTEASVATLTPEELRHYHRTHLRPDNLVVTLVGCLDPEQAIALFEATFGDWQNPDQPILRPALPRLTPRPQRVGLAQDTQQSIIMLGYLAPSVLATDSTSNPSNVSIGQTDPRSDLETRFAAAMTPNDAASLSASLLPAGIPSDYAALKLLNTYLGNGLSSRLFVELREKRGLAYDVSAFYPTRVEASQFAAYIGTAPQNTEIALDGLKFEIDRLTDCLLNDEELETAKSKLLGQYALGKQTNAQIAQILGWYEAIGLGTGFDAAFPVAIEAVTAEAARETARRYFRDPYVSVVGPEEAIAPVLHVAATC